MSETRAGSGTEATATPQAGRRLVLTAVMLAMFMSAVEATIVAAAMPTIVAVLGGFHLFSWVFAIYLLTQSVTIPIYGRLADLYGGKRVLTAGAALFLLGSALCGFAPDMTVLILCRGLQGLGAGAIMPVTMTIVGDLYPGRERARIQGLLSSIWAISAVVGPLLGAFLVEHGSWPLIFWLNLPAGAAALVMLAVFFREPPSRRRPRIDWAGSLLLMTGSGSAMLALIQATRLGTGAVLLLLGLAAAAFALFLAQETRTPEPIVPLRLLRLRIIAVGNVGGIVIGTTMMGIMVSLPIFVQGVMGRSPLVTGVAITFLSIGWPIGAWIAGRMMVSATYRATAVLGGFCLVAGGVLLTLLEAASGPVFAALAATLIGLGMGFANTTFIVATQGAVTFADRGAATSLIMFTRLAGQALGAALFGAVLNFGLERRLGAVGDTIDRLMEPAQRSLLSAGEIARATPAVAAALHEVFLVNLAIAIVAFVLTLMLPQGASARDGH